MNSLINYAIRDAFYLSLFQKKAEQYTKYKKLF